MLITYLTIEKYEYDIHDHKMKSGGMICNKHEI